MANTEQEFEGFVSSPDFAYARKGDGLYRGATLVYHSAPTPTGVALACAGDSAVVDALIRKHHNTSPVSPTERVR